MFDTSKEIYFKEIPRINRRDQLISFKGRYSKTKSKTGQWFLDWEKLRKRLTLRRLSLSVHTRAP